MKHTNKLRNSKAGFTLVEVLAATLLFVLAIFAIVDSQNSSQRSLAQSERMFYATLLAQSKMTEMELKFQKLLDANGLESSFGKENGSFDAPWDQFKWTAQFKESSVSLSPAVMEKYMISMGIEPEEARVQMEEQALVLTNVNKLIKENYGELTVNVSWEYFGNIYSIPLLTHLIPKKPKIELTTTVER